MLDRLYALETFGIKLGLENITRLCAALGHPERSFLPIHIAGTNGKGSISAFVHAALTRAGLRAGRYTSPHLVDLRERFVVGTQAVDPGALAAAATHVLDTAERLRAAGTLAAPPTFFEATTAIAFELFRRAAVPVAVIEVGLGGRFDATNVVEARVGAITSIARDHEEQLGRSIRSIAFEKAGIIKPDMTVVTGALPAEAMDVITDAARARGARVVRAADAGSVNAAFVDGVASLTLRTAEAAYGPLTLALRGEHQVGNALVAARVLEAAAAAGVPVSAADIVQGLATAEWPARLEMLALTSGGRILLDAAHNEEGARALAAYLSRWHPERPPLAIGVMADKDVDAILAALLPVTSRIVATGVAARRALAPSSLAARVAAHDPGRQVDVVEDPLQAALHAVDAGNGLAVVAGSIYLAGAVRGALVQRAILRSSPDI
ncbi:MAG: folylpolyglutamate synthase/dihydrofolate synthase family protein [Vicinamibacterales bacterium]